MLVAYSLADIPFEPKYLVLASLLLTIWALYPVLLLRPRLTSSIVQAIIAVLTVASVLPAGPSYLAYKNLFRDRTQENAAALDMKHYNWWTWIGWGETAYPIARHVEENSSHVTVAFDYISPFYTIPSAKWIDADFLKSCQSADELKSRLAALAMQSVDFLVVSKNMTNRNWCSHLVLRRLRNAALFVDVQQGVEYGWLFRLSDVVAAFPK
jgi:hypothetical protein